MHKVTLGLLLSVSLAFGAMSVHADHHGMKETEKQEMKADTNNDGKVSFEEFKAARMKHMEEHFKRRDTNGDGFIDQDEKKAAREHWKDQKHEACKRKKGDSGE